MTHSITIVAIKKKKAERVGAIQPREGSRDNFAALQYIKGAYKKEREIFSPRPAVTG